MKALLIFLAIVLLSILWPASLSLGACPEDPNDNGLCDTLYVEAYPSDLHFTGAGQLVRVTLYVTHDLTAPVDSLAGMVIPLCFTRTNPTKYCSLTSYWNAVSVSGTSLSRSIIRDIEGINNRFLDMYAPHPTLLYNDFYLDVSTSGQHFWFWWAGSNEIQRWKDGSRILTLTMTFRVEDSMTVCVDSCFWPPSDRLAFARSDAALFVPRHNLPYCFQISYPTTGDANGDGTIDVSDVVFLINYLFRGGSAPDPMPRGDANCDQVVDISDVVFLINYLFRGGPAPFC
ncbi:MAG TPA: dockerin type I repeat-containing protein [candidate division Zixibacteria bacterium]